MKRLGKKDRRAFAAIRTTLVMLQDDALDPRLGSHKLKGDLAGLSSGQRDNHTTMNPVLGQV
jgi:mRNA-degrading endonuclease YafQ of YafQ-DinJ toxin-antitoxin module